ncbi:cilia- and flagella-associated protein 251-like [Branchiostoma lanceolatum]|uniref:cilia- and flagella-associated protein 251-like n=1 Tax=Branchiostoma lanceolatum TaxID=7740 RepID=UPI00345525C4
MTSNNTDLSPDAVCGQVEHKYEDVDVEFGGVNVMLGSGLKHAAPLDLPPRHPDMEEKEQAQIEKEEEEVHKYEDVDVELGGVNVMLGSGLKHAAPPDLPPRHPDMEEKEQAQIEKEEGHKYEDVDVEFGGVNVMLGSGLKHAAPPNLPPRHPDMEEKDNERARIKKEVEEGRKYEDVDLELGGINVMLGPGLERAAAPELPPRHPAPEEKEMEPAGGRGQKKVEEGHTYLDVDLELGGINVMLGPGLERAAAPELPPRHPALEEKEKEEERAGQTGRREEEECFKHEDVLLEMGGVKVILGSGVIRKAPPELPPRNPAMEQKEKERARRKKEEEDEEKENAQDDGSRNKQEERMCEDVDLEHGDDNAPDSGLQQSAPADTPLCHLDMGDHVVVWPEQKEDSCSEQCYKPEETTGDEEQDERSFAAKARDRAMEMWNQMKSSKVFWHVLGLGLLILVSVVTAASLSTRLVPGEKVNCGLYNMS